MKNLFLLIFSLFMLTGCKEFKDQKTIDMETNIQNEAWRIRWDNELKSTKGLEDCEYHQVQVHWLALNIIRCPHSTTTTEQPSKNPVTTVLDSE